VHTSSRLPSTSKTTKVLSSLSEAEDESKLYEDGWRRPERKHHSVWSGPSVIWHENRRTEHGTCGYAFLGRGDVGKTDGNSE
jgi:hypothetical protein